MKKSVEQAKKKLKFSETTLQLQDQSGETDEVKKKLDGYIKEPYNNDIGKRFKLLNARVTELKSANEKALAPVMESKIG